MITPTYALQGQFAQAGVGSSGPLAPLLWLPPPPRELSIGRAGARGLAPRLGQASANETRLVAEGQPLKQEAAAAFDVCIGPGCDRMATWFKAVLVAVVHKDCAFGETALVVA